jgi:hypothetical protein
MPSSALAPTTTPFQNIYDTKNKQKRSKPKALLITKSIQLTKSTFSAEAKFCSTTTVGRTTRNNLAAFCLEPIPSRSARREKLANYYCTRRSQLIGDRD